MLAVVKPAMRLELQQSAMYIRAHNCDDSWVALTGRKHCMHPTFTLDNNSGTVLYQHSTQLVVRTQW